MEVIVAYKEMYPNTLLDRWQSSVAEYGRYSQEQVSSTGYDQIQITNSIITTSTYSNEIIRWYAGSSHFPRFCISNSFIFENTIENENCSGLESIETKDYQEQFAQISSFFSFNKSEWARIFSVSRVSIYDWLSGKTTPTGEKAYKISSIYKLIGTLPDTSIPISRTYLYQNIQKYNKSLLDIFLTSTDISKDYEDLSDILAILIRRSKNTHDRLARLAKDRKPNEATLDYNLSKLRF
ncbi:MAG: hypothetical protein RBQ89_06685 [Sphaerochaeta sp.]|jgi:hypothetical protein|nr:hypothetical protein [Sphaerochaeta sp.]